MEIIVKCDRCGKEVKGINVPGVATAGYYAVGEGKAFAKYARPGESIVCDDCMQSDPAFQAEYGIGPAA